MTSQQPIPSKKRAQPGSVAELRLQLADRDRRLAELTEQTLQILDRLAEAREAPNQRAAMLQRISELQELLADTRQRLRLGTRAVLANGLETDAAFEVVTWGADAAAVARGMADAERAAVVALLGPDEAVTAEDAMTGVSVHETECRSPAHFWNEALAVTHAPIVVLVASGVTMAAAAVARLAQAAGSDGIAVASPLLESPAGRTLGRSERSLLDLIAQQAGATSGVVAVPFASPEVFAIARAAFEQLGPFDQDLGGDLALAEWLQRAGARSLRCVGVADSVAVVRQLRDSGADTAGGEADRLIVLARHRPQQLGAAAMAANALWQQEPMSVAAVLRAIFRRLPNAGELAAAVDLLVVQAQTIAGWKRIAPALKERLLGVAAELRVSVGDAVTEPGLVPLAERLQAAAAVLRERSCEIEARSQEAHELRQNVESQKRLEQDLRQDIIARSNTIDALRHELLERERAIASLREELGHRQGERDRLIDHLGHVQQELDRLQDEVRRLSVSTGELEAERSRLREDLQHAQETVARLEGEAMRLGDVRARVQELERRLADELDRSREIERQLGQAVGRTLELDPQLSEARHTLQQLEQMRADESARLQGVLREIDDLRGGHESLRREHGSLQEQRVELESRAHELVAALRDRERWIATLLHEVQERRLVRRQLTAYEAEFLARFNGAARP